MATVPGVAQLPQGQVAGRGETQRAGRAGTARPAHAQTTRTRAHSAAEQQALVGGPAGHRAALSSILVQWAAKVAFFKLKLDQLMDSLCRVCLAESKQNLEDKKPHSHGVEGRGRGPAWPELRPQQSPPPQLSAGT